MFLYGWSSIHLESTFIKDKSIHFFIYSYAFVGIYLFFIGTPQNFKLIC